MINDIDRNSRTLILCFVIAVFALIPLRFVEYGNESDLMQPQVLGEYVEMLPVEEEAEIKLEAPYDTIDLLPSETEKQPEYFQSLPQE